MSSTAGERGLNTPFPGDMTPGFHTPASELFHANLRKVQIVLYFYVLSTIKVIFDSLWLFQFIYFAWACIW